MAPNFLLGSNGFHKLHAPFLKERRTRGRIQGSLQEIRGVCAGISGALHGLNEMGKALPLFSFICIETVGCGLGEQ